MPCNGIFYRSLSGYQCIRLFGGKINFKRIQITYLVKFHDDILSILGFGFKKTMTMEKIQYYWY
jgi:hypothetical protein